MTTYGSEHLETLEVNTAKIHNLITVNTPSIFYAYDSVGGVMISMTPQTLDFNTTVLSDPGYSISSGEITVSNTGVYQVSFCLVLESDGLAGTTRGKLMGRIELDDGSGYVIVPGSLTSNYIREQSPNLTSYMVTKTIPIEITIPNSKIKITFLNSTTTTVCETEAGASTIYITKLR